MKSNPTTIREGADGMMIDELAPQLRPNRQSQEHPATGEQQNHNLLIKSSYEGETVVGKHNSGMIDRDYTSGDHKIPINAVDSSSHDERPLRQSGPIILEMDQASHHKDKNHASTSTI